VTSQQLPYLDVLLRDPWTVAIGRENGFPFKIPKVVQIVNPASFLAQKLLIQSKRRQEKFAKDILYVHDTLEIFGAKLGDIKQEWCSKIRPDMHAKHIRKVERRTQVFGFTR